jgi:hypothetical protein
MADAAQLNAFQQGHAELFLQFPCEGRFRRFAVANLSTGEFPLQRGSIVFPALADQQSPVTSFNDCRDDDSHARSRVSFTE